MFAVIATGGKQYVVSPDRYLDIERLQGNPGDIVTFDNVLMMSSDEGVNVGHPVIEGAYVEAMILDQMRDDKVIVFKKKRRQNYRRKHGHKQHLTCVLILNMGVK